MFLEFFFETTPFAYGLTEGDEFGYGVYIFGTGFGDEFVEHLVCLFWGGLVWVSVEWWSGCVSGQRRKGYIYMYIISRNFCGLIIQHGKYTIAIVDTTAPHSTSLISILYK